MPRTTKPLTDIEIRKQKPSKKIIKLNDGKGLYLEIRPTGGNRWRLKYRFAGKEKIIDLGSYPSVSLTDAREKREAFRKMVADGTDPAAERKQEKAHDLQTFEHVAHEWHRYCAPKWTPGHAALVQNRLKNYIFPFIGQRPVADIRPAEILPALRKVEALGYLETARKIRGYLSQIFRYAAACDYCETDPAGLLAGALTPPQRGHRAAVVAPKEFAQLLRAIDEYSGSAPVRAALRLAPILFQRPGELRRMEWSELDLSAAIWSIPAEKMKMRQAHIVPLSSQALAVLREIQPLTGDYQWVFPQLSKTDRPISENALSVALKAIGYDGTLHCAHGFRASFRTLADEVLHQPIHLVEHQLGHKVRDALGRAYNRTTHLKDRVKMMQTWSDYCDELKRGGQVIPLFLAAKN